MKTWKHDCQMRYSRLSLFGPLLMYRCLVAGYTLLRLLQPRQNMYASLCSLGIGSVLLSRFKSVSWLSFLYGHVPVTEATVVYGILEMTLRFCVILVITRTATVLRLACI